MSQDRRPDEDMREFLARLGREFQPRSLPPEEQDQPQPDYRDPASVPPVAPPQRMQLALPVSQPRAVYVLLAINVLMYGVSLVLSSRLGPQAVIDGQAIDPFTAALYFLGAKENGAINAGQWWRLLTPMVLHGSVFHLLFNSWALYALGADVERVYGMARFVAIYLLAGLAGSIASYVFNSDSLSVGASGAIFGMLGALAAFSYTSRSLIGPEASRMQLGQMATLAAINLAFGFAVPNIDNSAHIGGLIVGGLVGFALAPRYVVERRGYLPSVERRDSAAWGWGIAGVALLVLIGLFGLAWAVQLG